MSLSTAKTPVLHLLALSFLFLPLFIEVPRIGILGSSPYRSSKKFSNHSVPERTEGSFAGPDFWALRLGVYF